MTGLVKDVMIAPERFAEGGGLLLEREVKVRRDDLKKRSHEMKQVLNVPMLNVERDRASSLGTLDQHEVFEGRNRLPLQV